ncbi:MAG: TatD family hydrolase [Candidatus Shapirobacteria bacterium]|nr:TatD family hydrolase [Candidatus Shapirobacteria bacterium]
MIDTHAHLDQILCDTRGKVKTIILAASDVDDSKNNLKLAQKYDFLLPAIGIHPQSPSVEVDKLEELINQKIIAIGECGLEFVGDFNRDSQETCFRKQIELAKKYKLPLIIHARKAVDEVVEILKEYKNITGVFHCYAGGKKRIQKILDLGFYLGIDGNLTYEDGLIDVVKNIPRDRLILETDCPYLTPIPFRGKENKPAYIKYIYEKVSKIWGINFEETEKIIDKNAKKLFKIV